MSQYIPDITERFPEGFGGVDMTDRYFPSKRMAYEDWMDDWYDGEEIPYEEEITRKEISENIKPKRFEIGQHYMWTSWFTGGQSYYTVKEVTDNKVVFTEYRREIDGEYEIEEEFDIHTDEDENQYLVMCTYRDEEGRLYAEEEK